MQRLLVPARTLIANRDFLVLLVCNILLGLAYSFIAPFMSLFGTLEVHMTEMVFGLFMTTTVISAIVISTILARWSDTHLSRRAVLSFSSFCGALGYGGYAYCRDVIWLTVIGSTLLAVATTTFSQLFAHARELLARSPVPANETPLYMNVFRMFFALSWTIGPALGAWALTAWSYQGIFLLAAATFLVLFAVILWQIPSVPPPAASAAAKAKLTPLTEALRRPDLLAYFSGLTLICACVTMGMMNLPLLVLQDLAGNQKQIGLCYVVAPIFELPFMFYFGWKASRGDQAKIMRWGAGIGIVYYALLAMVHAPWHIYPVQILSAAMIAVTSGVAITFFQDYLPGQMGTATNLYSTATRIGSTAGYLAFGLLAHLLGHRGVFVICTGLCAVALLLFYLFRPRKAKAVTASPA